MEEKPLFDIPRGDILYPPEEKPEKKKPRKPKRKKPTKKTVKKPVKNKPMPSREAIWTKYLKKKQKGKCYCCRIVEITPFNFHIGHNKARSKGGSNHIKNLRPICASCNYKMGNRSTIEAYRKKLFGRKRKKTK